MVDADAFRAFYRANYSGLVAQLYAYTGDLGDAQDAAQEAFVRAWLRWKQISSYDDPRAWVSRVGYNLVISRWRKARTSATSWMRRGPNPSVPEPDGTRADIISALKRLPEAQRRALVLYYLGGFPVGDLVLMEGAPEGTIKARLARGRQALASLLASHDVVDVRRQ